MEHLFDFITATSGECRNPTAAQYFTQIVESLISRNQLLTLSFIFSNKHVLQSLIANLDLFAYKGLVGKVLNFYRDDDRVNLSFKFLKYRFTLSKKVFDLVIQDRDSSTSLSVSPFEEDRLKNATELLADILKDKDKILDSDFFIDRILFEKKLFKKLALKCRTSKSVHLLRFLLLVVENLFGLAAKLPKLHPFFESNRKSRETRCKKEHESEQIVLELPEFLKRRIFGQTANEKECGPSDSKNDSSGCSLKPPSEAGQLQKGHDGPEDHKTPTLSDKEESMKGIEIGRASCRERV